MSEDCSYDKMDWKDLPSEPKAAAVLLGFDEGLWAASKKPESCSVDWIKLTAEQQAAAKTIGYDKVTWDANESDEK